MNYQVVYKERAKNDVRVATKWYESQRMGLGHEFLICLEEAIARVQRQPELYPKIHGNLRRVLLKRFPYSLFYLLEETTIYILSVFDNRQDQRKLP